MESKLVHVYDFVDEFAEALKQQLIEDEKQWGDTWLHRVALGHEARTEAQFADYFDQYRNADIPVPWLKIAGGALICWIRDNHPELSEAWQ